MRCDRVIPALLLLLLVASPASATGINVYWNDCSSGATASLMRTFACNTNSGTNEMVASIDPPVGMTAVTGAIGIIDLCLSGVPLPPWWQFINAGSCRPTALGATAVFTSGPFSCADYWQGQANAVPGYQVGYSGWDSARILVSVNLPPQLAAPMPQGTEYYMFKVTIRNTDTVGPSACGGCNYPACIVLNEIRLTQPAGTPGGSPAISNPLNNNYLQWQAFVANCPFIVPVKNRTWGQIKSLYR
jgi:hypothetical protein